MEYAMVFILLLTQFILQGYSMMIFLGFAKNSENDRKIADEGFGRSLSSYRDLLWKTHALKIRTGYFLVRSGIKTTFPD